MAIWSLPGYRLGYYICIIFYRHADLNELLDSNKDRDKLEAMRRIIEVCFGVSDFIFTFEI